MNHDSRQSDARLGPRRSASRRRRGFTLVEAIATIAVLAVALTVASRIVFAAMDGYASAAAGSRLVSDLSSAMEVASAQLRDLPGSAIEPLAPEYTSLTDARATWGGSGVLELVNSELRFRADEDATGPRVLVAGATALQLRAFDQSGNPLPLPLSAASLQQVRQTELSITAERAGLSRTLRTRVFHRCGVPGEAP